MVSQAKQTPGRRAAWYVAEVVATRPETPRAATLTLAVAGWPRHRAGQHVDVRLTAEDGYQAVRSYSLASPPEAGGLIELAVERLEDGEVSSYLVDEVRVGDRFEVRGPIGGYFVWTAGTGGPLLLVGGGSGVAPPAAMLRHRAAAGDGTPTEVLCSARGPDDALFRDEIERMAAVGPALEAVFTFTRVRPPGWTGYARRVDQAMLGEVAWPAAARPLAYVCGPTRFVEAVADGLAALGYPAGRVRTERFGPTGGRGASHDPAGARRPTLGRARGRR